MKSIPRDSDGSEIIDLTKKVKVYMTKKAPHHAEGEENSVHPKIAEHFIKRGFATSEAPKGKGNGKTVDDSEESEAKGKEMLD